MSDNLISVALRYCLYGAEFLDPLIPGMASYSFGAWVKSRLSSAYWYYLQVQYDHENESEPVVEASL